MFENVKLIILAGLRATNAVSRSDILQPEPLQKVDGTKLAGAEELGSVPTDVVF